MTEIYEKLTPVVGPRAANHKEEAIEDVVMEDIKDVAKVAPVKRETSETQATSSTTGEESQPSAESVRTETDVKVKEEVAVPSASVKVEVPVDTSKESKQGESVKVVPETPAVVAAKVSTTQEPRKEGTETESNAKMEDVAVKVETVEKSPVRTTRSTEDKKNTPAKK